MTTRFLALCALVLAVLAAPAAAALGDDLFDGIEEAQAMLPAVPLPAPLEKAVGQIEEDAQDPWSAPVVRAWTSQPDEAEPQQETDKAAPAEDAPRDEPSPRPASPFTRLIPVPMVVAGVVPKIDVGGLQDPLDLVPPFLPTEEDGAAPAPRPVAAPAAPLAAQSEAAAPVAEPVAALVALAAVAGAAGVTPALTLWLERLRNVALFSTLYTRIGREQLLDHERREMLIAYVRANPGQPLADIAEATAIPRNTATYHLRRLEREGLVSSARQGRTRHYFVAGGPHKRAQAEAFAALRHDTSRAIALQVGATPGLDQQTLCARFGLTPSLAHWHADRLVSSGLVEKRREGRHVRYYPGEAYALVGHAN